MKNKKILLLSLALLGVVGTQMVLPKDNVVNKAEAAGIKSIVTTVFDNADESTYNDVANNVLPEKTVNIDEVEGASWYRSAELKIQNGEAPYKKVINTGGASKNSGSSKKKYFAFVVPLNVTASIYVEMYSNGSASRNCSISSSKSDAYDSNGILTLQSTKKTDVVNGTAENLTTGTYYLHCDNSINYTKIVFTLKVPAKCSVTFDLNGNEDVDKPNSQNIDQETGKITIPGPIIDTIEHKYVEGWYENPECLKEQKWDFNNFVPAVDTKILYAKWESLPYATFDANGGTFASDFESFNIKKVFATVEIQDNAYLLKEFVNAPNDISKKESKFLGWSEIQNGDLVLTYSINKTYYAKWEEAVYADTIKINKESFTWSDYSKETDQLTVETSNSNGQEVNVEPVVSWSTDKAEIVNVDQKGQLTLGGKSGEAVITAKIYEGTDNEKSTSITITVEKTKLSTVQKIMEVDFAAESKIVKDDGNYSEYVIYDSSSHSNDYEDYQKGKDFGGFVHSGGTDIKWNGDSSSRSNSLMTNGTFTFKNVKSGTLTIIAETSKTSRHLFVDNEQKSFSKENSQEKFTFNIEPGEHTISGNGDNLYYVNLKFVEDAETNYVDTNVHMAYQFGKTDPVSEKNDSVRFIGYIAKEALEYLDYYTFTVEINGKELTTNHQTTVYTSVYYYDGSNAAQMFQPENYDNYYYFTVIVKGIPSEFSGEIKATANVYDANGNAYSLTATAQFN